MVSSGLFVVLLLYGRKVPNQNQVVLSGLNYHWNKVALVIFAPLITLWFLGLTVIFLAGGAMGIAHIIKWLHP